MAKRVLIIDGHPDAQAEHYLHALSTAYRDGALSGGHTVRSIIVSELPFSLLRTKDDFESGSPTASIRDCQAALAWAEHVVILFPLWLGSMPALLKGFFEQVLRPGFAFAPGSRGGPGAKLLMGKSARVVITMGMPALFYRWYFRGHSLKALKRNVLGVCGIWPVRASVIGPVESMSQAGRGNWLARVQRLGKRAR
jgi:putative NADPH-quinone reductase